MSRPKGTTRKLACRLCFPGSSFESWFGNRLRKKLPFLLTLSAIIMILFTITRLHLTNSTTKTRNPKNESLDVGGSKDFVCLFTTFKPEERKMQVYENVLYNWMSLASHRGQVRCILYETTLSAINRNDTLEKSSYEGYTVRPLVLQKLVDMAVMIGWDVVVLPRVSPYDGLPYFKDMYFETAKRFPMCKFSTFVNADIMFGDGLMPTLVAVDKVVSHFNQTLLLIGRRTDVDMDPFSSRIFSPHEVNRIALRGALIHDLAQDYFFIYKNNFPWHAFANIVIGRIAYDNYIVMKAHQTSVSVIDITRSVVSVHQSIKKDGHERSSRNHSDINHAIIGPFNWNLGVTSSAQYITDVDKNTSTVNVHRRCGKECLSIL